MTWWYMDKDSIYQSLTFVNEDMPLLFLSQTEPPQFSWQAPLVRLQTEHYEYEDPPIPGSDFPGMGGYPAWSQRAVDVLHPLITDQVLLFPLQAQDEMYYLVYIKFRNCLDYEASKIEYFEKTGNPKKIYEYAFKENCLDNIHLFRLPKRAGVTIVSDTFKTTVEEHELKGLTFKPLPMAKLPANP